MTSPVDPMPTLPVPFAQWVEGVREDDVCIDESDVSREARENMWAFGVPAEHQLDDAAHVELWCRFTHAVIDAREATLGELGCQRASFVAYVWWDTQAGQLRIGLMSASHGDLPFRRQTQPVALETIVKQALDPYTFDLDSPLLVWATVLPRGD